MRKRFFMPSTNFPAGTVALGNNDTWARAGMFGFAFRSVLFNSLFKKSTLKIPSSVTKASILRFGNGTGEGCSEI